MSASAPRSGAETASSVLSTDTNSQRSDCSWRRPSLTAHSVRGLRAKLHCFGDNAWHERRMGKAKLFKSRVYGKVRFTLRHEKTVDNVSKFPRRRCCLLVRAPAASRPREHLASPAVVEQSRTSESSSRRQAWRNREPLTNATISCETVRDAPAPSFQRSSIPSFQRYRHPVGGGNPSRPAVSTNGENDWTWRRPEGTDRGVEVVVRSSKKPDVVRPRPVKASR